MSEAKLKILCIDDEAEIRRDIAEELQDAGYLTIEAADGNEGLAAITRQNPDLVVCDITMPVMTGHELLRKLREEHPEQADLPFIFLSALAERKHIVEGKKLGADDYMTKPVDFELLLATVESRLNQVRRMAARKQEQLVKVYKASMSGEGAPPKNFDLVVDVPGREAHHPKVPKTGQQIEAAADSDQKRLQEIIKKSPANLVGGRVQVIGLEEIKAEVGERWDELADKINELAESTIKHRLSRDDIVRRTDDGDFLICFATLNDGEAVQTAGAICRAIKDKILGCDLLEPNLKEACDVTATTHKVKVSPQEIAENEDVFSLVRRRVEQAAERARLAEAQTMAEIVETARIVPVPVMAQNGAEVPLVLSQFSQTAGQGIGKLLRGRPDSAQLLSEIDHLRLGKAAELLCQIPDAARLMVVDLEFSTLYNRRCRDRYLELCNTLTKPVRNHLAFNVRNIPTELLPSRIATKVSTLRPYCRFLLVETRGLKLGTIDPVAMRVKMISCKYLDLGTSQQRDPDKLLRFADQVHKCSCKVLLYNVPPEESVKQLFVGGVDFVACRT